MSNLAVGHFLPDLSLPSARGRTFEALRPSIGRTTVVVAVHSAACAGCREYLDSLGGISGEFGVWDGRLLIVVPGDGGAGGLRTPFGTVLEDERKVLASPSGAAVLVADRYGQVFAATHTGFSHDFPPPRQLEEWLKFLGTLCPE